MSARVRAEILRLATQPVVWGFAALLLVGGVWTARWSPTVVDLTATAPPRLTISVGGAVTVAATHLATGLGVMLAALFAAAGPGRDFVDGSAETRQACGTAAVRFGSRVLAVAALLLAAGVAAAGLLVAMGLAIRSRNDYAGGVQLGTLDPVRVGVALLIAGVHAVWTVALAQRLRTQAGQLVVPAALTITLLLISRLSPHPVSPDSWVGPLLHLPAERAMLDFWWSVGGEVLWPWGNVALLATVAAGMLALGLSTDRRGHYRRLS